MHKTLPKKHSTPNVLPKEALQKAYQWFEEYLVSHLDIIPSEYTASQYKDKIHRVVYSGVYDESIRDFCYAYWMPWKLGVERIYNLHISDVRTLLLMFLNKNGVRMDVDGVDFSLFCSSFFEYIHLSPSSKKSKARMGVIEYIYTQSITKKGLMQVLVFEGASFSDYANAMQFACMFGKDAALAILLPMIKSPAFQQEGYTLDFDGAKKSNCSPLEIACFFGHVQVANALLKQGASLQTLLPKETTPLGTGRLHNLVNYYPRMSMVMLMVLLRNGFCVECFDVHWCLRKQRFDLLQAIVSLRPHLVREKHEKISPLAFAIRDGRGAEYVECLLKAGADANEMLDLPTPRSLLHMASDHRHAAAVCLLIRYGANVQSVSIKHGSMFVTDSDRGGVTSVDKHIEYSSTR